MKILEVKSLIFPEIKVIRFQRFADNRGYFSETFRQSDLIKIIPEFRIKQVNESHSKKGAIRGLHFQWNPYVGKLVRTVRGHMVDLFLDIRKNSPNFGKIGAYEMPAKADNDFSEWIWVAVGFAHGNFYLEKSTIEYICTDEYNSASEAGISPLAEDINWTTVDQTIKAKFDRLKKENLIISDKDKAGLTISQWKNDDRLNNFNY